MTTGSRGHGGHATNKTQSANAISNWQLLITNAYAELHRMYMAAHMYAPIPNFCRPRRKGLQGACKPSLILLGGDNLSKPLPRLRMYLPRMLFSLCRRAGRICSPQGVGAIPHAATRQGPTYSLRSALTPPVLDALGPFSPHPASLIPRLAE